MIKHLVAGLSIGPRARAARVVQSLRQRHAGLSPERRRQLRRLGAGGAVLFFGAVAAFGFAPLDARDTPLSIRQVEEELPVPVAAFAPSSVERPEEDFVHAERVRRGDTLASLLTRMQVNDPHAEKFVNATPAAHAFYQLRPGRLVLARTNAQGALLWLRYLGVAAGNDEPEGISHSLVLERHGADFSVRDATEENERHIEMRSGTIQNSLFGATDAAAIPESIAVQITEIFAGDLDFYRDVRRGDQFRVVYEMYDQSGEPARAGRVLAVEYGSGTRLHQAVWFQPAGQPGGYYGFGGQSLRRAFLRAPLQFTRVSSGFGGRMHPILNTWRWHAGIDYAAPLGTPVRATGDGVVVSAGWQNGYGNAVVIRHQGAYSTLYGHLSAFAKGLHPGQTITQGELIGNVGMTGWATGPHLHYEFRINGSAHDPAHAVLPEAPALEHAQLAAFLEKTRDADREIELLRGLDTARADAPNDGKGA
jgi:murein DD-endopeptidase MepM/ murein hydrolase activator NlpD